MSQTTLVQRFAEFSHGVAQLVFVHDNTWNALVKKSTLPKLPDFSASAMGALPDGAPTLMVHGTPGSICGPMRSAWIPSACTTAPEVSPPATTSCPTPASTKPRAIFASACSVNCPAPPAPS